MSRPAQRTESELMLDLLFHGLRVRDAKMNEVAVELFSRFGVKPIRRLALEAVDRKNTPSHRLRAMTAIERIGDVSNKDDLLDLCLLLADPNEPLRAAAFRFLRKFGPAGGAILRPTDEVTTAPTL